MRVAVTGGTGLVGRFVVDGLVLGGHSVVVLSRRPSEGGIGGTVVQRTFDLGAETPPGLDDVDALVHAALDHLPGRYRGGEGDDPEGFRVRNLDGTRRLFDAARQAGVGHLAFLSSRAVYGGYPAGTRLDEALEPRPDTLYGEVKRAAEMELARLASARMRATILRVTGVYGSRGSAGRHKWSGLFDSFALGEAVPPRIGTEVHGEDVAAAVTLVLDRRLVGTFNVSDFVLDHADLLQVYSEVTGVAGRLPARSDPATVSEMATVRLRAAGWRPRGPGGLRPALRQMCDPPGADGA